jgi:hypothetical protein
LLLTVLAASACSNPPPAAKSSAIDPLLATDLMEPSSPLPWPRARVIQVREGDTIARLASEHGTSVDALMSANNKTTPRIFPGDRLMVPAERMAEAAR